MSLLELIARRSATDASAFSLPDLLAEQALARLLSDWSEESREDRDQLNLILAEYFAHELLRSGADGAKGYTDLLFHHGISEQRFLNEIIPGSADTLGRAWEEDRMTFAQVTCATAALIEVARERVSTQPISALYHPRRPRALLMRVPGEDHVLGLILTAQELRRRGWLVRLDLSGDPAVLTTACKQTEFNAIGFTIGGEYALPALREVVSHTRRLTNETTLAVGGALACKNPEIAAEVGADISVDRAGLALEQLVNRVSRAGG